MIETITFDFSYDNEELKKISDDQIHFACELHILSELDRIGAIKYTRIPIDNEKTNVKAEIKVEI